MNENKKFKIVSSKKTRYLLPNILTIAGVCLGISSIKFSIDGNFNLSVTLILFAAILDALDGRIARLIKGTSDFGKELDSLTDFVSFGIAPVFILYFWELNNYGKLGWAITLIYSVCCVLRLARFNLNKIEETEQWKNNYFALRKDSLVVNGSYDRYPSLGWEIGIRVADIISNLMSSVENLKTQNQDDF